MLKNNFVLLGLFFLWGAQMVSAQGKIEFEKTVHDFGKIKEDGGAAQVVFSFKNSGNKALTLKNVSASCGCTTPEWSKEAIAPGKSGYLKASYNPLGRPGKFDKTVSVTVQTDTENANASQLYVLRISGEVMPRAKGVRDWYPIKLGNLRFKTTHIVFGDVLHNQSDTASTIIYNDSDAPITLDVENSALPKHIEGRLDKTIIKPKETATLSFTYKTAEKNDWGYNFEYFSLKTNDTQSPHKRINLSANIRENFGEPVLGKKLPKVKYDKLSHNFGQMKQQSSVSTDFTVRNTGQAPLIIRKTKASCGCTASRPEKTTLMPGESTQIKVTFSSGSRTGKQKKSLTVITNDPAQDVATLWIEAEVETPKAKK